MTVDTNALRRAIRDFAFRSMFIELLGWDNPPGELPVEVDGRVYRLRGVAQKRGLVVFQLETDEFLPAATRNKIETRATRSHHEHILIFTDAAHTRQTWLWALREPGRPIVRRGFDYHAGQSGEATAQRLAALAFSLAEEDDLTLVDVSGRVRAAFNVERATKKFYDQFKRERDAFEKFVSGIPDTDLSRWYVSVMLNRLMFVYFIQKKGFLDGDPDYLRNRLATMQAAYGEDRFDRFYRYFLLRLFHEGLGRPDHDPELERLIGRVPYLNGGIFQQHEVEAQFPDIRIPDEAFERVFDFFDQYQWHLDDRPLRDDREINPDVLGYIFEKYINQKQMGAYYTREDITEYISKNTIIPFLFDRAREGCAVAFQGSQSVWAIAAADPDRYIYPAVRKGTALPLPVDIAAGLEDVAARTPWNTPAPDEFALPTEIWRETVARRRRYEEVRGKLAAGEVTDINDFITLNLDIRQFAQDVIEQAEGADLLVAFWRALTEVSVLDPTCGSGAFLFAALNVLEPLYEAAVGRMREFAAGEAWRRLHPRYARQFDGVLADIDRHPNETYFIQKAIIVNNLYGVDIMAEAVEIAKLRLFLKLASQLERVEDVEPLPDIDFNIRAGNTLVGYVKREEVRDALTISRDARGAEQRHLLFAETQDALAAVEEKAADIDRLYNRFRALQTDGGAAADLATTKAELRRRLAALNDELDRALARQYGVDLDKPAAFDKWRASHQPFHWFTEFYGILHGGGFDVVIGNPPYLNLQALKDYGLRGFSTTQTRNLYPIVLERCQNLVPEASRQGYIVPVSATSTEGYLPLQAILEQRQLFVSSYDDRPAHLFTGLDKNTLSIILLGNKWTSPLKYSTRLQRWNAEERDTLFELLEYQPTPHSSLPGCIPKIGNAIESQIWRILFSNSTSLKSHYAIHQGALVYYSRKVNSFLQALDFVPIVRNSQGEIRPPSEFKVLRFTSSAEAAGVLCCLNSTLFRWFVDAVSDGSHLNRREVDNFPFDPKEATTRQVELTALGKELSTSLEKTSEHRIMRYAHDTLTVQCIIPKYSKVIIDKIDAQLRGYYDFTDEELDFIINYDIKYRMGDSLYEEED